ncbi:MAG TPA: helix-turn-helix domain-containing protein, partial [Chthoniobacterales bacterium]|nr:helix-turn-helix domain-containing protein [Chthoniobacterales bacterium]
LTHHFARLAATRLERPLPQFGEEVLQVFSLYDWPGNVRELRNVVENMILLGNSDRLRLDDVPAEVRQHASSPVSPPPSQLPGSSASPNLKLSERAAIESAVAEARGNMTNAAKRLGIARSTLYRKLEEYGIARPPD